MAALIVTCTALTGCADDRLAHADAMAQPAGLQRALIKTDEFVLTAYSRITRPGAPLHVYIEGDGASWISRTQPSLDPTPRQAMGLALAAADAGPNVVYIARPCQFTPMQMNGRCSQDYWTGKRFAPVVVAAMNQAVGQMSARSPGAPIDLIGYSGGGALAILIAARRSDVASIRTVAGNLDIDYVNRINDVSAMPDSENPARYAGTVSGIPQLHFSGADDRVVPPAVAQRFVRATGTRCATAMTVSGLTHDGDWAQRWPMLLKQIPVCH